MSISIYFINKNRNISANINIFFLDVIFLFDIYNVYDFNNFLPILNNSLLNGLLLIHPIFLYSILLLFIFFFINYTLLKINYMKIFNSFNFLNKNYLIYLFISIITSVFLGAWWAQVELNWGGWWGWDLIEIISLNYLIIVIFLLHQKQKNLLFNLFIDIFIKIVFFVIIIKFNYLDSIHNFVSAGSYTQNFYQLLHMHILLFYISNKIKSFDKFFYFFKKIENVFYLCFFLLLHILNIYIYYEFLLIFFKNNIYILFFFKIKLFIFILFILLCTYTIILTNKAYNILIFTSFWEFLYFNMVFYIKTFLKYFLLHYYIFIFLYITIYDYFLFNFLINLSLDKNFFLILSDYFYHFFNKSFFNVFCNLKIINFDNFIFHKTIYLHFINLLDYSSDSLKITDHSILYILFIISFIVILLITKLSLLEQFLITF